MSDRAVPGTDSAAGSAESDGAPVRAQGRPAGESGGQPADVPVSVETGEEGVSDRILTVPNLISALRLLLVPVVAVLILDGQFLAAVVVLAVAGISDWVDGVVARALNQTSRLGRFLDPAADRLFIAVAIIGLAVQDVVPWWLVLAVFGRDVVVGLCVPFLVARGFPGFPVHDIGKAGTFALMYSFPLLLLAQVPWLDGLLVADISWALGWAAAIWGIYLYWSAGVAYLNQFRAVLASDARASSHPRRTPSSSST